MENRLKIIVAALIFISACSGNTGSIEPSGSFSVSDTVLSIKDKSQFIGGPMAQAQLGDILMSNDKISVIIQQASKYAQSCPFGGVIIDADIKREDGKPGQDNFGKMCPLVNIEWTVNYQNFEVISDGKDGGPQIVKATGTIDVLDYLDLDFIAPVAKAVSGLSIYYSPRFDDANDPFKTYEDLKGLDTTVVTEYRLDPGQNYIKMDTTFTNNGDKDANFPVGEFVNGSGQVQTLLPGLGFTPQPTSQITGDTPAIVYVPFDGVDVSYGYFYDVTQFENEETSAVKAQKMMITGKAEEQKKVSKRLPSASLSYSGVTGIFFGEDFLKVLALGGPTDMKINFKVPAHGTKTITQYLAVGNGNAGSVFDYGLSALKIPTHKISGRVVDAEGNPVQNATVVVQNNTNMTLITYRTGPDGSFSGTLSTGEDDFAKAFGSGKYKIFVEKQGYIKNGTNIAGSCNPPTVDVTAIDVNNISCTLGETATVELVGGVIDADTGDHITARLTIVGFDPSPDSQEGAAYATTHGAGNFEDTWIFERPWGVVDLKYVNLKGGLGLDGDSSFKLEPGHYAFVFSHGLEYGFDVREFDLTSGSKVTLDNIKLKHLINTKGWISADFHLHSIASPDSSMSPERRVLAAVSEGEDIIQSSDHDWLVDYAPYVDKLEGAGIIPSNSIGTIIGDEVSPNHIGHINVFPLEFDSNRIDGGALDWTHSPFDTIDPSPDFVMSPREVIDYFKSEKAGKGEKVLQVNHIAEQSTSLLVLSSWVTTTAYKDIPPLSSFIDPAAQRVKPNNPIASIPTPYGTSDLVIADFSAVEVTIGADLYSNLLRESGLPQWFNLLNLGILATGTADSDSHREIVDQLGMPRNYISSSIDPHDGAGSYKDFNKDAYAHAINQHHLFATSGPFVTITATGEDGSSGGIGDTVKGKNVKIHIEIKSPSWAWFDTVEIYANTEPLPADDDGVSVFKGVASDPKSFFAPYHIPKFYYEPQQIYTISDGSLKNWQEKDGVITASLDVNMNVEEDTWVVVFVAGTPGTEGFRSLFPFVTKSVTTPSKMPKPESGPDGGASWTLDKLVKDSHMKSSAWAFANPVFIDVDGDTDGDGNPFEAKYIRSGVSPLAKKQITTSSP